MLLSHTKKFIYLKTKKTAGTSTEVLFQRWCVPEDISTMTAEELHYGDEQISDVGIVGARGSDAANYTFYNHMPAVRVIEHVGLDTWQEYFKFANVRNPFTRAVSQFFWRRPWLDNRVEARERKQSKELVERLPDLPVLRESFLQMIKETKRPAVEKFLLTGHPLDFYVRYESLDSDIAEVIRRLDLDPVGLPSLPKLKAGSWLQHYPDYRVLFTDESKHLVETTYRDWIAEFGYQF